MNKLDKLLFDEILKRVQVIIHMKDDHGAPLESYKEVLSQTYDTIINEIKSKKIEIIEALIKHI